jgi:hypothetical protein
MLGHLDAALRMADRPMTALEIVAVVVADLHFGDEPLGNSRRLRATSNCAGDGRVSVLTTG